MTAPLRSIGPNELPALTIRQPHIELILCGEKLCENRTWRTRYRGRIVLHAACDPRYFRLCGGDLREMAARYGTPFTDPAHGESSRAIFGHLLGMATLVDCVPKYELRAVDAWPGWAGDLSSVHVAGPWCWLLADVERFENPQPWQFGRLGLWPIRRSMVPTTREFQALHAPRPARVMTPSVRPGTPVVDVNAVWGTPAERAARAKSNIVRPAEPVHAVVIPAFRMGKTLEAAGKSRLRKPCMCVDRRRLICARMRHALKYSRPSASIEPCTCRCHARRTWRGIRSAGVTMPDYEPAIPGDVVSSGEQ